MINSIFYNSQYKELEQQLLIFLQSRTLNMTANFVESTRSSGDMLEKLISSNFLEIIGKTKIDCQNYTPDFPRRAMADLAFTSNDGNYYIIDVKSHRLNTSFNMPNLTSVERLARFYEDYKNHFVICLVEYSTGDSGDLSVSNVKFIPIEFLSWQCLTLGALGWGQIQIANSNNVIIQEGTSRRSWMFELCDRLVNTFYPKEIEKIGIRMNRFKEYQDFWLKNVRPPAS